MSSRQIIKRVRREHALTALLRDYRGDTVEAVARRLAPCVEPGDDIAGSIDCLLRAVERLLAETQRDSFRDTAQHSRTMDRVAQLRRERNGAARELRGLLVEIRDTTTLLFGRKASNCLLLIQGATARAKCPDALLLQAHLALEQLESPGVELPEPRIVLPGWEDAAGASRKRWSESLRAAFTRLEQADKRLQLETHGTDSTRLDKQEATNAYHQDLSAIANLQEALLVLGREPEIARTIWERQRPVGRPARRKRRKRTTSGTRREETTSPSAAVNRPR